MWSGYPRRCCSNNNNHLAFISWQSRRAVNRSNGSRENDTMNWSVLDEAIPKSSLSTALNVRTRGDISPGDQSQSGAEKTNTTSADDQQPLQLLGPALLTPWTNPVPSLHRDRCDSVTQPTLFTKFLPSQPFHWSQATVILLIGLYIKTPRCISYLVHVDGMKRRHKGISGRPTFSSPPLPSVNLKRSVRMSAGASPRRIGPHASCRYAVIACPIARPPAV